MPPEVELLEAAAEEIEPAPPPKEENTLRRGQRERCQPSRYVHNMTFYTSEREAWPSSRCGASIRSTGIYCTRRIRSNVQERRSRRENYYAVKGHI